MKRILMVMAIGVVLADRAVAQSAAGGEPPASVRGQSGPPLSACQRRLTPDRVIFRAMGEVLGPGGCGGADVVYLERIVTPDQSQIAIEPPATLRCETADAIVDWVRSDLTRASTVLGSGLAAIENFDSYDCRGRNRVAGAPLSEHGRANALDIRSFRLKDGRLVRPTDPAVTRDFRQAMKTTACVRFMTVLGPGSDGYHEDHIHVDLAERHGGYRTCQWDLHDGAPDRAVAGVVAPAAIGASVPLPRSRPFISGANSRVPLPQTETP